MASILQQEPQLNVKKPKVTSGAPVQGNLRKSLVYQMFSGKQVTNMPESSYSLYRHVREQDNVHVTFTSEYNLYGVRKDL